MAMATASLLYVLCLSAMIVFNIAGNSLVCLVILKKKAMKTPINWFLFHLAIADLLVAVFFIPPCILSHFIEQPSGVIGDLLCKFITEKALGWAAASASSFLLVVIAFERYKATLHPLQTLQRSRSPWLVPILWTAAILLVMPSLVVLAYDAESQGCIHNFPDYTTNRAYSLTWSFANSVLTICIMGYLYTRIILCLRNRVLVPGSSPNAASQSRHKVTKMLITVSIIFITCWTPPTVLCGLSPVNPVSDSTVSSVSTACALLNSCLNPLVYTLHSQQFRKNLASLVPFAGLALVYVIQSADTVQYTVKKTSDVENFMTSVERVTTYTKLDSEPGYKVGRPPPEHWPREGNLTFQDVSLTYYPGGPQVLKKINLNIKGGAKIGVAGRTGAGKSSFVAALMRMPDADGEIMVDNTPIKQINLQEARRCVSVLGQSPVLFGGSLRKNLDLVEQFQDIDLWRALEDVQLNELVDSLDGQLDHELLEHGANVSVGEWQLICLARVLLQQSKIIILDEPTAHVDPDTEQTIWNVVREKLGDSTVITIAHRLNAIKDCDMILALKNGEVAEFDKFDSLGNREGSALSEMARVADI
ncbi:hypothetical protein ACROYT_G038113 [Oculina patagonica]